MAIITTNARKAGKQTNGIKAKPTPIIGIVGINKGGIRSKARLADESNSQSVVAQSIAKTVRTANNPLKLNLVRIPPVL